MNVKKEKRTDKIVLSNMDTAEKEKKEREREREGGKRKGSVEKEKQWLGRVASGEGQGGTRREEVLTL